METALSPVCQTSRAAEPGGSGTLYTQGVLILSTNQPWIKASLQEVDEYR